MMTSSSNTEIRTYADKIPIVSSSHLPSNSTIELLFRDYCSPWTCFGGPSILVPL